MIELPQDITEKFFTVLEGTEDIGSFENWIYETRELEELLSEEDYLELISFNFTRQSAPYELRRILEKHIDSAEFATWQLRRLLNRVNRADKDLSHVIASFYDLYCKGYSFLQDLGLGYGLCVQFPMNKYSSNKGEGLREAEKDEMLDNFFPGIEVEANKVLKWLDEGKIVITGTEANYGYLEFQDHRTDEEKKSTVLAVPKEKAIDTARLALSHKNYEETKLAFSPDGKKLFSCTKYEVLGWSLESRKFLYKCPGSLVAISEDSQTFLTKRAANTFRVWDAETGGQLSFEEINPNTYPRYKRSEVVADREKGVFTVLDALGIYPPITIELGDKMQSVDHWTLSLSGEFIAVAHFVDVAGHDKAWGECIGIDGKTRFEFNVNRFSSVPLLYFAEHHPWLAVESRQNQITLYHLETGKPIQTSDYQPGGGSFFCVGPSRNQMIVLHYASNTFQVKSDKINKIITEPNVVFDVTFHPDGNHIASLIKRQESHLSLDGSRGEEIRLYNLATLELVEDILL